jgi:NAD(P)-dependent dehydrogenase (short-subunit alcohol dehydrogenase family)
MKKTVLITGGTGGIGKAAALALATQGDFIIFQGRDVEKGKKIVEEISVAGGTGKFIASAMSSVDDVKNIASEVKKLTNKIDVFIHSTGALNSERREIKDGYDEGLMVNYLNKFILDNLLLNELKNGEGRIIIVGAPLMKSATINLDDLQIKTNYSLMKMMGQAMLAVHMHAQEFAKRSGNHPTINILHPGIVNTGIMRNVKGIMKVMLSIFGPLIGNSADKAIINIMHLATTEKRDTGYFYHKVGKSEVKQKISLDSSLASKLWDESLKLARL